MEKEISNDVPQQKRSGMMTHGLTWSGERRRGECSRGRDYGMYGLEVVELCVRACELIWIPGAKCGRCKKTVTVGGRDRRSSASYGVLQERVVWELMDRYIPFSSCWYPESKLNQRYI